MSKIMIVSDAYLDSLYGKMEPGCASAGGMCIMKNECPSGALANAGLCPSQTNMECCHSGKYHSRKSFKKIHSFGDFWYTLS